LHHDHDHVSFFFLSSRLAAAHYCENSKLIRCNDCLCKSFCFITSSLRCKVGYKPLFHTIFLLLVFWCRLFFLQVGG
jgi:hypothetical protein